MSRINEQTQLRGDVKVLKNGVPVFHKNLIVTAGKSWIAGRLANTGDVMSHIGVGTGTTAAALSDTALEAQVARQGMSNVGGTVNAQTVTYSAPFPAGVGTGALTEAGLFNAATGGTMLSRVVFGVITKEPQDELVIEWTITVQ